MESILNVSDVSVTLQQQEILRNISFEIGREEIVAIIGPNGSGKTTLIKTILDLVPYKGDIRIFGQPIRLVLHRVGYVPQRFEFDRHFPITVEEFLLLSLGHSSRERIPIVLKETGMEHVRTQLLGRLSGGEMQRVLIARAILRKPDLLILDEPTSGIDIEGIKDFYELIRHLNTSHHVTVLMISHEINIVYKFATRIVCLNKDLICHGSPEDVLTREVLQKLYGKDAIIREHPHEYLHHHL